MNPSLRVRADRACLRQILRNLGLNAIEAGGAPVEVGWRRDGREAEVYLRDHGPGLAEEIRARVFEPFFTTKPRGTGLGLAIARDLAERLGGRLALEPARGRGHAGDPAAAADPARRRSGPSRGSRSTRAA